MEIWRRDYSIALLSAMMTLNHVHKQQELIVLIMRYILQAILDMLLP